jgi:AcrR family transcriptional regulator
MTQASSERRRAGARGSRVTSSDPRSAGTRALLLEAFQRLAVRDGFATVTAAGVAAEAKVSRSAFYDHFASPHEVAEAVVEDLFEQIARTNRQARATGAMDGSATTRDALLRMTRHMYEHHSVYRQLLLSPASGAVSSLLLDKFAVESLPAVRHARSDLTDRGVMQAARVIAGAVLSTMTWWLQENDDRPAEVLAGELFDLLPQWFTK